MVPVVSGSVQPEPVRFPELLQLTDVVQPVGVSPVQPQVSVEWSFCATGLVAERVGVGARVQMLPFHPLPKAHVPVTETEFKTEFEFLTLKVVPSCATVADKPLPEGAVDTFAPV